MARRTKRIVIAIEYKLAPENPFPAGFNDCYDVIDLIYKNRVAMNIKTEDITIIGDSAGGNLSAAVCQKALNEKQIFSLSIRIHPLIYAKGLPRYSSADDNDSYSYQFFASSFQPLYEAFQEDLNDHSLQF